MFQSLVFSEAELSKINDISLDWKCCSGLRISISIFINPDSALPKTLSLRRNIKDVSTLSSLASTKNSGETTIDWVTGLYLELSVFV